MISPAIPIALTRSTPTPAARAALQGALHGDLADLRTASLPARKSAPASPRHLKTTRYADGALLAENGWIRARFVHGFLDSLRVDPAGRRHWDLNFVRGLQPENWEAAAGFTLRLAPGNGQGKLQCLEAGPFDRWNTAGLHIEPGPRAVPERLEVGHTLGQTFTVPEGAWFQSAAVKLPTWQTTTASATLEIRRGPKLLAFRRLVDVPDNSWQRVELPQRAGPGTYEVRLTSPIGMIGWWSTLTHTSQFGQGLLDGRPDDHDRGLQVDLHQFVGSGRLRYTLDGPALRCEAELSGAGADEMLPWRWRTSWTRSGYDCTPAAGVLFRRFFTDTQRYMPVEQLKRRDNAGLFFDGCRWVELSGTRNASLRLGELSPAEPDPATNGGLPARPANATGSSVAPAAAAAGTRRRGASAGRLHFHWEMQPQELSLRFDTGPRDGQAPGAAGEEQSTGWELQVRPLDDPLPATFPRLTANDPQLSADLTRFLWDRGYTYPAPAANAAWFDWMALIRAPFEGPLRQGEMNHLLRYPIDPDGYVHTWDALRGWPFPDSPPYDTRHFDSNARFILACWRFYEWTGDRGFLQAQLPRLRRAMSYQLDTLHGSEGAIVAASKNVTGRHQAIGDNYWDILPFGHYDAYANSAFYASLDAMAQVEQAARATGLNDASPSPRVDYAALRRKAHSRFDTLFWDDQYGRYIGCVDVDGHRHDYGFTFVNLEALYYGLGDAAHARRIYHWLEAEPTSSGKADTYSRWVFAPRATTIHNPQWGPGAPAEDRDSAVAPWWMFGWHGTPFGDQCQDGGAILYTSFFDLQVRLRYFGRENAWKRFQQILARYRLPDRLCGGDPLYRGEHPQQENPGSVGVDLPFPESGLVPLFYLYGVLGADPSGGRLQFHPQLPAALMTAGVRYVSWHGHRLAVEARGDRVTVRGF